MFTNNAQFPYISVIAAANIYTLSCMENLVVSEAGVSGATAFPEGSEQKTLRPQPQRCCRSSISQCNAVEEATTVSPAHGNCNKGFRIAQQGHWSWQTLAHGKFQNQPSFGELGPLLVLWGSVCMTALLRGTEKKTP